MKMKFRGWKNIRHHCKDWEKRGENNNQVDQRYELGQSHFQRLQQATWAKVQILVKTSPSQTQEDKTLQQQVNEKKIETKTQPEAWMGYSLYMGWKEVHGLVQGEWFKSETKMPSFL